MKHTWVVSLTLMLSLNACADRSGFKGDVKQRAVGKSQNATPTPVVPSEPTVRTVHPADPVVNGSLPAEPSNYEAPVEPEPIKEVELSLEVKVSALEVRAGKNPIQAEAIFMPAAPVGAKIKWTLEGPAGLDLGTIDPNGKYLSPAKADKELVVAIVATLESDAKVTAKKEIKIIPVEQLFVGCKKGNLTFPISADVFKLPVNTAKLPDFSMMKRDDIVCLDKYDIPLQPWEVGFPGSPQLQEWFALHSKAKLNIAKAGVYEFRLSSDDGAKLYINGATIIDNDGTHSLITKAGSVSLAAGKQDLVLDYYQGPRTQVALQLFWKVPGSTEFVIVPAKVFSAE